MGKTIITAKVLGMAHLPVAVLWREISTIPNGQNLGQMKSLYWSRNNSEILLA